MCFFKPGIFYVHQCHLCLHAHIHTNLFYNGIYNIYTVGYSVLLNLNKYDTTVSLPILTLKRHKGWETWAYLKVTCAALKHPWGLHNPVTQLQESEFSDFNNKLLPIINQASKLIVQLFKLDLEQCDNLHKHV